MEGLARVQARISSIEAQIQARLRAPAPTGASSGPLGVPVTGVSDGDFSAVLAQMMGEGPPSGTTPDAVTTTGGAIDPPAHLATFGNGRIPPGALTEIGDGHRLATPASDSFARLRAAAAADGVTIEVTDSYRSYQRQVELAQAKGLHSHGGLAATPGTSAHGWGLALDLDLDAEAQRWMRERGGEFGFVEDVPREPWHWTYRGAAAPT